MAKSNITRRQAFALGAGALIAARSANAGGQYRVGVGVDASGYAAALRAITASAEWGALSVFNRTVIIKPNLVSSAPPESGHVTDPEVVRAVVDLALAGGATRVLIVETAPAGAHFDTAGYGFFSTYDPLNRVELMDMADMQFSLAPVPGGYLYGAIRAPVLTTSPDVVFISVGKLKTHLEALVTLSNKNLFGLPSIPAYESRNVPGRFSMHDRSVNYAIADLCLMRPIDFALVDGIWGMEGRGPLGGTPVRMDAVFAGKNALAVDRVAAGAMSVPQLAVRHFLYLTAKGLGPSSLSEVDIVGDALSPKAFKLPILPPILDRPYVAPSTINPAQNESATIIQGFYEPCVRKVDVLKLSDEDSSVTVVRTLVPYGYRGAGAEYVAWDGRADDGSIVPADRYAVHSQAYGLRGNRYPSNSLNWVTVAT